MLVPLVLHMLLQVVVRCQHTWPGAYDQLVLVCGGYASKLQPQTGKALATSLQASHRALLNSGLLSSKGVVAQGDRGLMREMAWSICLHARSDLVGLLDSCQ